MLYIVPTYRWPVRNPLVNEKPPVIVFTMGLVISGAQ